MDLTLIRSFLAVAETGAITEAAERIGITQPALSRRLQQFEDHLGVPLMVRGRKGATLTEIGRLVQSEAQAILARYEHMQEMVNSHQRLEGGTVRIGGGATAVSYMLPEAIAAFQAAHPQVRFQMREAGSSGQLAVWRYTHSHQHHVCGKRCLGAHHAESALILTNFGDGLAI